MREKRKIYEVKLFWLTQNKIKQKKKQKEIAVVRNRKLLFSTIVALVTKKQPNHNEYQTEKSDRSDDNFENEDMHDANVIIIIIIK